VTLSELAVLAERWQQDLAAWAIPDDILAAADESPWVLPRQVFARRADRLTAAPSGPSFGRAADALDPPGSVLDVGSGAGAACLPLVPRATSLTAVDESQEMLRLLADRAAALGMPARCVPGRWPAIAPEVATADVVTCHHVLYNAPDVVPFISELTSHARRIVVAEVACAHPLTALNGLWARFHGLRRPDRPTGDDVLAILEAMGLRATWQRWRRPGGADYASFAELVAVTRRRLCLPGDRAGDVAQALIEAGADPEHPADLGSSGRDVLTIWWDGTG